MKRSRDMKRGKRLLAFLLVLVLSFSLASCATGNKNTSSTTSQPIEEAKNEISDIGLIQYATHPSLDAVRDTFMNRLEEWGYNQDKIKMDYQNANGKTEEAAAICSGFVEAAVDMIVAISTPAAKAAVEAVKGTDIKVVFIAVNDPQSELGMTNLDAPEGNITGTSDKLAVEEIIELALKVNPGIKNFGFAFDVDETSSVKAIEACRTYVEGKSMKAVEGVFAEGENYAEVVKELCDQVDAVFVPTDNTVAANMEALINTTKEQKKPLLVASDAMVQQGALAAIAVDYQELAAKSADMVVEILAGKPVSEVPVKVFAEYNTYINQTTLEAIGAAIPDDVMQGAIFYN